MLLLCHMSCTKNFNSQASAQDAATRRAFLPQMVLLPLAAAAIIMAMLPRWTTPLLHGFWWLTSRGSFPTRAPWCCWYHCLFWLGHRGATSSGIIVQWELAALQWLVALSWPCPCCWLVQLPWMRVVPRPGWMMDGRDGGLMEGAAGVGVIVWQDQQSEQ